MCVNLDNFRNHGDTLIVEGQCHSGSNPNCHGSPNQVSCCQGHYEDKEVGPTDQCTWEYFDWGQQMECGRSDEIIVGRCGSGSHKGEDRRCLTSDKRNVSIIIWLWST